MTPVERLVMHHIEQHPNSSLLQLANGINLRVSNASAAVTSLVKQGFVERARSKTDRRGGVLNLTPRARENIRLVHAEWLALVADAPLDERDVEAALRVFSLMDQQLAVADEGAEGDPRTKKG